MTANVAVKGSGALVFNGDKELTERQRGILKAVINSYIRLGRPVSSKELKNRDNFPYSTATLRNEMSVLERNGYLTHEHTSSGRVPTDKGYRYYVNEVLVVQKLASHSMESLSFEYIKKYNELNRLMLETSTMLSSLSSFAGFAVTPRINSMKLKRLELIRLDEASCAVLLVTDSNVIKHKVLQTSCNFTEAELRMISDALNSRLAGMPLTMTKKALKDVLKPSKVEKYMDFFRVFDSCIENLCADEDIFLDGTSKVLRYSAESPDSIERIFENKSRLSEIIEKDILEEGLRVWIGDEINSLAFRDFSIIRSTFSLSDRQIGLIGIIGPKRMEYNKMTDIVLSVSESLSKIFGNFPGEKDEK